MHNLNKTARIIFFFTVIFFVLWLGGYIARQLIIYQFFEPENLGLLPIYNSHTLPSVLRTFVPLIALNLFSFVLFIISFLIFIIKSKLNIRKNGWLFITLLIVLITAPFELYLSYKDYIIIDSIYFKNLDALLSIELIKNRLIILSSFSLMEIFSYIGIIYFFVFQPLTKK